VVPLDQQTPPGLVRKHPQYWRALRFYGDSYTNGLSADRQSKVLTKRGLEIGALQPEELSSFLSEVNFFRASGYFRYFQFSPEKGIDNFQPNTKFDFIKEIYELDNEVRSLLFAGVAKFEISFRSRFAYLMSELIDEYGYLQEANYLQREPSGIKLGVSTGGKVTTDIFRDLDRSREKYIIRHISHGEYPPIWAAIEALSMGTVSKMYQEVINSELKWKMAKSYGLMNPKLAGSTFRSFTVLRNLCAHHSRVWNRVPDYPHPVLKKLQIDSDRSIYHRTPWAWIVSLAHIVDSIEKNEIYSKRLLKIVESSPDYLHGLKHPLKR
jgi:abortive infection bacteriophage resistance protein